MTDAGGRDRREASRFGLGDRARMTRIFDDGRIGQAMDCVIEDVSSNGVRLRVSDSLAVEQLVTLETEAGGEGLAGYVRWVQPAGTEEYVVGIEAYRGPFAGDFFALVKRARAMGRSG